MTSPDPSLRAQLQDSLGEAYLIEDELGGGGMSRVFVARERALDRRVVVKLLPHDLAGGIRSERFRREIQLVAGLQHPYIVPVLATGDAAGAPYYTMPFIQGESLRSQIAAIGAVPVPQAVHILHDVIDALAYAHARGVVHRDIKPDNILMSGSHALVTDFGVAKAITAANEAFENPDSSGTVVGMAVGTPAYMAPEQAAGDPATDHRADIYAWGLLAYELLAGAPPFGRRTPREMLAAHVAEIPEPLDARSAQVPQALADLVMRCLEKRPDSRPATAAEVREELERVATPGGDTPILPRRQRTSNRVRGMRVAVPLLVLVAVATAYALRRAPAVLDERQVAVMPFRVASADRSLRYLREGMLDLLAAKLTGEAGPRSSDPRTVLSAWRRAAGSDTADLSRERAIELAEGLGAGQLLVGDITGTSARLTLTASLVWVRDGRTDAPRSVSGPADSLPAMVDRLASELLALRAGEGERMPSISGVPLAALRPYLNGTALYRRAKFAAAANEFRRAIDLDSTFALAGLGLATAAGWMGNPKDSYRGSAVAWSHRDRLGARDQALLMATAGPNFPALSGWAEMIAAKERYASLAPDRADAQFELGDGLFHFGASAGIPDAHARAVAAFNRTLALDSSFSPAIEHLIILEMERRDSARVVALAHLYLAADTSSENRDGVRWSLATVQRDTAAARRVLVRHDSLSAMASATIMESPVLVGVGIESAQLLLDQPPHAADRNAQYVAWLLRHDMALNRGRPTRGRALLDSMHASQISPGGDDFERVRDALFWDGDTTRAEESARALVRKAALGGPVAGSGKRGGDPVYFGDVCMSALWTLSHGDTTGARRASAIIMANFDTRDSLSSPPFRLGCAFMLRAQLAVTQRRADAHAVVDSLDAFLRTAPRGPIMSMGNLAAARMYERLGDTHAALFAIRRRDFFYGRAAFYSTYLRDEARLAQKAGDAVGAADALRRYVAMRSEPESSMQGDLAEARTALTRTSKAAAGR